MHSFYRKWAIQHLFPIDAIHMGVGSVAAFLLIPSSANHTEQVLELRKIVLPKHARG